MGSFTFVGLGPQGVFTNLAVTDIRRDAKPASFAITHLTRKVVNSKTTVWSGNLRATTEPGHGVAIAQIFSALSDRTVNPGDMMGKISITVRTR